VLLLLGILYFYFILDNQCHQWGWLLHSNPHPWDKEAYVLPLNYWCCAIYVFSFSQQNLYHTELAVEMLARFNPMALGLWNKCLNTVLLLLGILYFYFIMDNQCHQWGWLLHSNPHPWDKEAYVLPLNYWCCAIYVFTLSRQNLYYTVPAVEMLARLKPMALGLWDKYLNTVLLPLDTLRFHFRLDN
jgi:hypothetical protein